MESKPLYMMRHRGLRILSDETGGTGCLKIKEESWRNISCSKGTEERPMRRYLKPFIKKECGVKNVGGGQCAGKYYSGRGSDEEYAVPYVKCIRKFMEENRVFGVVDLGCGDFRVSSGFAYDCDSYVGVDCVEELINYNRKAYGNEKIRFLRRDIVRDELPEGELCLIRQVLQHLSNKEISEVLRKCAKYKYVIVTEHLPNCMKGAPNVDKITGMHTRLFLHSGVYLALPPFSYAVKKLGEIPYDKKTHLEIMQVFLE